MRETKAKGPHLHLVVRAALRPILDFLLNAMSFVASMLDDRPMVSHGLLATLVGHGVLGIDALGFLFFSFTTAVVAEYATRQQRCCGGR